MKIRLVKTDGSISEITPKITAMDNKTVVSVSKEAVGKNVEYVDFLYDYFTAKTGDKGYFVLPFECLKGVTVSYFNERPDTEYASEFSHIYCYGYKKEQSGIFGIITGCKYDYALVAGVKGGNYYAYPRFLLEGDMADEDIAVEYYELENGDYSEMARIYRKHQIENEGCEPLSERVKRDSRLERAAASMAIRVRQGWKPAPSKQENQTLETEPDMHVALSFDDVGEIVDEFKYQGIKNAEFCLVGWNRMGHDGRYPQIFPAEPKLGGEEKLRKLIKKAKNNGYNIVGHTNGSDAYTVSELWDEEYLLKTKDGGFHTMDVWSSGRAYKICPQRMYERFGYEHNEKLKELGFEGIHYSDVITILTLLKCHDKNHPLTRRESAEWYRKFMQRGREVFGGFSSESGYDFAASALDYALYTSFILSGDDMPEICDEPIPFWQIVYHGIVLYNPGTYTLNYPAKGKANRLKYFEFGGRPLACVYANFAEGKNWMGNEDLRCETKEEMRESVSKIKLMTEDYDWLKEVRFAFMESHNRIADGVFKIEYSNGYTVTVDYNASTVKMSGNGIEKQLVI